MNFIVAEGIDNSKLTDFASIPPQHLERFFMIHNYSITRVGMYTVHNDLCYCFYNRNRGPEIWIVPRHGSINGGPSWDEFWENSDISKAPLQFDWDSITTNRE